MTQIALKIDGHGPSQLSIIAPTTQQIIIAGITNKKTGLEMTDLITRRANETASTSELMANSPLVT